MNIAAIDRCKGWAQLVRGMSRDESGAFAIVFTLCATVFLGFVALGIDTYRWHRTRSEMIAVAEFGRACRRCEALRVTSPGHGR